MPISARILIENLIAEYCSLPEDESAYYDLCEKAEKIVAEYGAETIFDGCIAYLSGAQITAENVFPFAYMFFCVRFAGLFCTVILIGLLRSYTIKRRELSIRIIFYGASALHWHKKRRV